MKNIVGIGHIAIRVKEIDRTLDFYRNRLGFKEMFRLERDGKLWLMYPASRTRSISSCFRKRTATARRGERRTG